jgi:hypothetical protein
MHETSEVDQKAAIRTIIERIPGTQFVSWIGPGGRREREEEKHTAKVLWTGQARRLTFTQEDLEATDDPNNWADVERNVVSQLGAVTPPRA